MKTSEKIEMLAAAMSKAQGAMKPAAKDSLNPHFKSKYADLASVWEACRGPLTANGLSIWQDVENHGQAVSVTTRVVHDSGQWAEFGPLTVPLSKDDAHGVGSATTYGKRFGLSAAIGIVSDVDDDGNASIDPERDIARPERSKVKDTGRPPCPVCKSSKDVIVSKFGPGFYCLKSKTKFDPVRDEALSSDEAAEAAVAFD